MQAEPEYGWRPLKSTKTATRLALAPLLALIVLILAQLPASADGGIWCITDPVVSVGGQQVNILVAIPAAYQENVTGPVSVQVTTGPEVAHSLIATDPGFNGYGEQVQFVSLPWLNESTILVTVQVPLSADTPKSGFVPVQLTLDPAAGGEVTVYGSTRMTAGRLHLETAG